MSVETVGLEVAEIRRVRHRRRPLVVGPAGVRPTGTERPELHGVRRGSGGAQRGVGGPAQWHVAQDADPRQHHVDRGVTERDRGQVGDHTDLPAGPLQRRGPGPQIGAQALRSRLPEQRRAHHPRPKGLTSGEVEQQLGTARRGQVVGTKRRVLLGERRGADRLQAGSPVQRRDGPADRGERPAGLHAVDDDLEPLVAAAVPEHLGGGRRHWAVAGPGQLGGRVGQRHPASPASPARRRRWAPSRCPHRPCGPHPAVAGTRPAARSSGAAAGPVGPGWSWCTGTPAPRERRGSVDGRPSAPAARSGRC